MSMCSALEDYLSSKQVEAKCSVVSTSGSVEFIFGFFDMKKLRGKETTLHYVLLLITTLVLAHAGVFKIFYPLPVEV